MLLETFAAGLQATGLSQLLRTSIWLYPLVNLGHVLGIALLFGAIVPVDLRLLGCWKSVPLDALVRVLVPVSITGLLLAVSTGALLFATRPLDYIVEPLLRLKMLLLAAAIINALLLRRSPGWHLAGVRRDAQPQPAWRIAGLLSLLLWLGVITTGRLIGYR